MDVGKLGEAKLDEITNNAYEALTSVNYSSVLSSFFSAHFFTRQPKVLYCELHCSSNLIRYNSVLRRAVLLKTKRVVVHLKPLLPCAHTLCVQGTESCCSLILKASNQSLKFYTPFFFFVAEW